MQSCAYTLNKCKRPLVWPFAASNTRRDFRAWRLSAPLRQYASISAAELQFGQPLHETHPHLLKAGERKLKHRLYTDTADMLFAQSLLASQHLNTPSAAQSLPQSYPRMPSPY